MGKGGGMVALIVWFRYYYTIPRNCTRLLILFFLSLSLLFMFLLFRVSLFLQILPLPPPAANVTHFSLFFLSLSFKLINTQRERLCTHTHTQHCGQTNTQRTIKKRYRSVHLSCWVDQRRIRATGNSFFSFLWLFLVGWVGGRLQTDDDDDDDVNVVNTLCIYCWVTITSFTFIQSQREI